MALPTHMNTFFAGNVVGWVRQSRNLRQMKNIAILSQGFLYVMDLKMS